jgi:hypothetical protein
MNYELEKSLYSLSCKQLPNTDSHSERREESVEICIVIVTAHCHSERSEESHAGCFVLIIMRFLTTLSLHSKRLVPMNGICINGQSHRIAPVILQTL